MKEYLKRNRKFREGMRRFIAYVLLTVLFFNSVPITEAYAAVKNSNMDLEWVFTTYRDEETNTEEILLEASPLKDSVEITGIGLPDGERLDGGSGSYVASENGTYEFTIYYDKAKEGELPGEETGKVNHKEKTVSYTVKDLDEIRYKFSSEFTSEEEKEKRITLEAFSDSDCTIFGIETPDGQVSAGGGQPNIW